MNKNACKKAPPDKKPGGVCITTQRVPLSKREYHIRFSAMS